MKARSTIEYPVFLPPYCRIATFNRWQPHTHPRTTLKQHRQRREIRGTDTRLIVAVQGGYIRFGVTANPNAVTVSGPLTELAAWVARRGTITNAPKVPIWI